MSDLTTCYKILNNNIDIDLRSFSLFHITPTPDAIARNWQYVVPLIFEMQICFTIELSTAGTSYQTVLFWPPALPVLRALCLGFLIQ